MLTILHTEASHGWGGQEIRIVTEALGMTRRGARVLLAAPPESGILRRAQALGLPVLPVACSKKNPAGLPTLRRLIKREGVDIVNTHSSQDSWMGILAARLCRRRPLIIRTRHLRDGREMRVTNLAHWSSIESLDGELADVVKWVGGDKYVGANSGLTYTVVTDKSQLTIYAVLEMRADEDGDTCMFDPTNCSMETLEFHRKDCPRLMAKLYDITWSAAERIRLSLRDSLREGV